MDFMHDQLPDCRGCRLFNVIDDFNCERLTIDADLLPPAELVIHWLNQIIDWCGKPKAIRCYNGSKYISHKLADWTLNNDIEFDLFNQVICNKMLCRAV